MQSENLDKEWVPHFKEKFKEEAINIAAAWSKIEAVKILLEEGYGINNRDKADNTPLHKACEASSEKVSLFLIEKGADVNAKNWQETTPLHMACHSSNAEEMLNVIKELIKKGAIVDALNTPGQTPLYIACDYHLKKVAELLLRNGADLFFNDRVFFSTGWQDRSPYRYLKEHYHSTNQSNLNIFDCIIKCHGRYFKKGTYGIEGLCQACADGELEIVKWFIEEKVCSLSDCPYLLCYAAQGGNVDLVSYLIDQGASVNAQDAQGKSPLHHACRSFCREEKIVKYLIEKGVDRNTRDANGRTPLCDVFEAVDYHHKKGFTSYKKALGLWTKEDFALWNKIVLVLWLIDLQEDINLIIDNSTKRTALHIAADLGFFHLVGSLIEKGADVHAKDKYEKTPFYYGLARKKLARYFISKLEDVNAIVDKKEKSTPLHIAAHSNYEAIKQLIEKGANIHARDADGRTPLYYALTSKKKLALFLIAEEKDMNFIVDEDKSQTALHIAAHSGFLYAVRLLIKKGANQKVKDKERKTALQYAKTEGHTRVFKFLEKFTSRCTTDYRKGEKLLISSQLSTRI